MHLRGSFEAACQPNLELNQPPFLIRNTMFAPLVDAEKAREDAGERSESEPCQTHKIRDLVHSSLFQLNGTSQPANEISAHFESVISNNTGPLRRFVVSPPRLGPSSVVSPRLATSGCRSACPALSKHHRREEIAGYVKTQPWLFRRLVSRSRCSAEAAMPCPVPLLK